MESYGAALIREARLRGRLTHSDLAERTGRDRSVIARREQGGLPAALSALGARHADGREPSLAGSGKLEPVVELSTDHGELKVIPEPAGTGGYEDLRRAATREHIGHGLRPAVASLGDLTRMLSSLGREDDMPKLLDLRRLAELEISYGIEI